MFFFKRVLFSVFKTLECECSNKTFSKGEVLMRVLEVEETLSGQK